jgi:MoaA/NifB/PqqE/SkfB family radical SAM enzyme
LHSGIASGKIIGELSPHRIEARACAQLNRFVLMRKRISRISAMTDREFDAVFDDDGRLILPEDLVEEFGLRPGTRIRMLKDAHTLRILRPVTRLARVYIEPTNRCNLECRTCIRNSWDEPLGDMQDNTFQRICSGIGSTAPAPSVLFGGLGEPLAHPDIVDMVRQVKSLGCSTELITNATLLDSSMAQRLIEAGLDRLWVSLDGSTPESYQDVRLGAALPEVIENLTRFRRLRWQNHHPVGLDIMLTPQLGIVFVAMKRNISDLPRVFRLANHLGALHFLVTNVLPYTAEMQGEILYARALNDTIYESSPLLRDLDFPKMDINPATRDVFYEVMRGNHSLQISGGGFGERNGRCPFSEKGALAIRWDGAVSPCLALLHNHTSYLHGYERSFRHYAAGNVHDHTLERIWNDPEYLDFRRRLQDFNFSPCVFCGGCDYFKANEEDCIGSPFPVCGGCLWAQGIIRCP